MSPSSYELILKNISRFIDLNLEEQNLYVSLLKQRIIRKKDFLLKPGEVIKNEYFIVKGCLKVYRIDDKGTERISMFAIKDWWTGDMASFITQQPSNYFIQALEESEVLQISRENYELLFKKIPKFERFYRILYQKSLANYIRRSDQNISLSAEDRYYNFVQKYPSLVHRVSQKDIASYIGVTPEFLSLLRKRISSS
ncbi:cAMP-binding domain of CRP or a regulatory subunit of cAMP-dependent protein kinases [Dokdonia pacifica]|uniref:cAMP-binding domain of CRP or a regulatory subunit of cAMP-dependent protein kinases n=2 Tax=Dokdonia pacifica TaxID=1627892 RepID=A0A239APC0_9FLAO|nr:cAMP-binding domain of CRP or a regulatory subunit of cAMP-dependent protein kinases [Dokdonia pacifica]